MKLVSLARDASLAVRRQGQKLSVFHGDLSSAIAGK